MNSATEARSIFKTRGPLDPVIDSPISVPRPELDQLLQAANAPTVDAYLAVLSSRQTGKTTLLYQLRARLRPRGYGVALIDLSVLRGQGEAELYQFVSSGLISELEPNFRPTNPFTSRSAGPPRARRVRDLPCNPVQFRQFLLEIARETPAPRLVILMDEVEGVPEKHADAFFGTIRNVFSSRRKEDEGAFEKYLFVIAGAKELHRLSTGPNSPLNIAERIYLQDFALSGVRALVSNFARASIVAPPETAQWLYEQTTGHPYLTQKLCSLIEQQRPGVITQEMVQKGAIQTLRSDDHLEKMILQIDADPAVRKTLELVVAGKPVQFSRLSPQVARLELLGAVRDAGKCVIRNPIYYTAFRTHFNLKTTTAGEPRWRKWLRPGLFVIALLFFVLNLPFLYNYARDIYWTTRSVNDEFITKNLGKNFTIHYERVLEANSPDTSLITVDMDGLATSGPIYVTFIPDRTDITLEGIARRTFDQPFQQERFKFSLNQSGLRVLRYNPFQPGTDHRQVKLVFESATGSRTQETYEADFVVDYYSAFIFSAAISIASFLGAIGAIFANVGHVRRLFGVLAKFGTQPGE